ncbi:MAG TPA: glutamyl-tRNA reductase [Planctomycetota bacterium]|nr:glutamyl-tRNA reductase [Planctomycetota bacterium]
MSEPVEDALRIVGLSHHKAPVSLREKLAFTPHDLRSALGSVLARGFNEAAILSTCNRVEVIAVARSQTADPFQEIRKFLSEFHQVPEQEFTPALYQLKGLEAARHLFEVTASLDSQILGETEILAQSKEAYRAAAEHQACGPVLHKVFERSFFLSKEVRSDGGISRSQASVSSAAVALANKLFDVKGRKVLVVGTGEMASGIVRALRSAGVSEILVASRTEERAKEFAAREGGRPCLMQNLTDHLAYVDIVLVSSAAPHYVILPEHIKTAMAHRRGRYLCLIDISVPRNVDPLIPDVVEDAYVYDIDDLEEIAREGRRERELVAQRWRPRLAEEARELLHALQDQGVHDAARKLIAHAAAQRQEILSQINTSNMDPRAREELARAMERLQGRLLHGPLEMLKQAAREGEGSDAAAWVSRLFKLELDPKVINDKDGAASIDKKIECSAPPPEIPASKLRAGAGEARPPRPLISDSGESTPRQATS